MKEELCCKNLWEYALPGNYHTVQYHQNTIQLKLYL